MENNFGTFKIIFDNTDDSNGNGTPSNPFDDNKPTSGLGGTKQNDMSFKKSLAGSIMLDSLKQVTSAVVANVGAVTGSSNYQNKINAGKQIGETIISTSMLAAVNPYLALAKGVSTAIQLGTEQKKYSRDKAWADLSIIYGEERKGFGNFR